jgi:molecular chaperone HscA
MLLATQSALDADGDLLGDEERAIIDASMAQLREAAKGSNEAAAIEAATKKLADDTEAFAAQRMNAGIARALAGRKVESL